MQNTLRGLNHVVLGITKIITTIVGVLERSRVDISIETIQMISLGRPHEHIQTDGPGIAGLPYSNNIR